MFWKQTNKESDENLIKALRKVQEELEELRAQFKRVSTRYEEWLEESRMRNMELQNKILKKVEYLQRKEENIDVKGLLKQKLLRRAGLIPKDINTWKDNKDDGGSFENTQE